MTKKNFDKLKDILRIIIAEEKDSTLKEFSEKIFKDLLDKFGSKNTDLSDNEYKAFKLIIKSYIKIKEFEPTSLDYKNHLQMLKSFLIDIINANYASIIKNYDKQFSELDWDKAEEYFKTHSNAVYAGSRQGLMYSYIHDRIRYDERYIYRRGDALGEGSYGRVKSAQLRNGKKDRYAVKRHNANELHSGIYHEARSNLDLGLAVSELLSRNNQQKHYQVMLNLGPNLDCYLKKTSLTLAKRLEISVKLILVVRKLHNRYISYTHGDIKPNNITFDSLEDLHLIDNATLNDMDLTKPHRNTSGTIPYLLISFNPEVEHLQFNSKLEAGNIIYSPNSYFNDKIATLRTIHHQFGYRSILRKKDLDKLPPHIKKIIETNNVEDYIEKDKLYTLTFIAAAIIKYILAPEECTSQFVQELVKDENQQNSLITDYKKLLYQKREEVIKLKLIRSELSVDQIPREYHDIETITPSFAVFLLANNLLPKYSIDKLAKNLYKLIDKIEDREDFLALIYNVKLINSFFKQAELLVVTLIDMLLKNKSFEITANDWAHLYSKSVRYARPFPKFLARSNTVMINNSDQTSVRDDVGNNRLFNNVESNQSDSTESVVNHIYMSP